MRRLNKYLRPGMAMLAMSATLVLSGCWPFASQSEVDRVKDVVDQVFTSNDPSICFELVTQRFLQTTYGKDLKKATAECQTSQSQGGGAADSTEVQAVRIDGARAAVTVLVHGGALDRRTAQAGLVHSDGWRMDSLQLSEPLPTGRETRKIIDDAIRTALTTQQGLSKKRADCFVNYLRQHASDAQLSEDLKALQRGELPPDFAEAAKVCK